MEEKESNKVQQFGVTASVRKMEQVPEAVGEDGLNKRMGLHVVTSCSYSNPEESGFCNFHSTETVMSSPQCLLHVAFNFSAVFDIVFHSLLPGNLLGFPETTFP